MGPTSVYVEDPNQWTNDEITVKAPDDYGLGVGTAKDTLEALSILEAYAKALEKTTVEPVVKKLAEILLNKYLPEAEFELELKDDESLWLRFLKIGAAIGTEAIPLVSVVVDVNLTVYFDVPVTVTTTGSESEPKLFRFTKDLSQIDVEDSLMAHLASPGELRIYDSRGRATGLVNGKVREEIPDSLYYNGTAVILSPLDSYTYEGAGTEEGTYGLKVTRFKERGAESFVATDIPITAGAVHQYTIDWNALSKGDEGVTLQIDSDGDGVIDRTVTSDDTLTEEDLGVIPPGEFVNHGPNPVPAEGCVFCLNLPGDAVNATIKIFDISGALLVSIPLDPAAKRYPVTGRWLPQDNHGRLLGTGLYLYLVEIRHANGTVTYSRVQKMVIKR